MGWPRLRKGTPEEGLTGRETRKVVRAMEGMAPRHQRLFCISALIVIGLAPSLARAELPQCLDVPSINDDYRVGYALSTGIWHDPQVSLHHRLSLQIPLWNVAAGAQLSFNNVIGEHAGSSVGNLRLFVNYFYSFEWARRANLWIGGGIDGYAPTATELDPQAETTSLFASAVMGDSTLNAPDITFGMRPRLHLGAEMWIFSVQAFAGAAIQFLGTEVRSAFEWGFNFSAQATDWLVLMAEATGVAWMVGAPEWMSVRVVMLGGGLRFILPSGFLLGLWARAPAAGGETAYGEGTFIGFELGWSHSRNWILF
jgi:hypothetical protein